MLALGYEDDISLSAGVETPLFLKVHFNLFILFYLICVYTNVCHTRCALINNCAHRGR